MEALAAVGLAGNILSFIDFGSSLVSEAKEIRDSVSGNTKQFDNLREMSDYLSRLSASLCFPHSSSSSNLLHHKPTAAESELLRVASNCQNAADDLFNKLKTFGNGSSNRGHVSSFRRAVKMWLGKSSIEKLKAVVEDSRRDLMTNLIVLTDTKQSRIIKYLTDIQESSHDLIKSHAIELNHIKDMVQDIRTQAINISDGQKFERQEIEREESERKQSEREENERQEKDRQESDRQETEKPDAANQSSVYQALERPPLIRLYVQLEAVLSKSSRRWELEDSIAKSLFYESISIRHEEIPDAHVRTFNWLLDPRTKARNGIKYSRTTLLNWLKEGEGIYWISGKPGSGKSTLMKFIADHPRTQAALNTWAGSADCITAAYYFWSAGTRLQKTIEGLLRSLLFDLLTRKPDLMQVALPDRWNEDSDRPGHWRDARIGQTMRPWTITEMVSALNRLSLHGSGQDRFCLFVDGLDEYQGDPRDVIKMIHGLSKNANVKLCVSSRPWNVFDDHLGHLIGRKLLIHELTYHDIREYTLSTLQEDSNWKAGALNDPRYEKLIEMITDRADGVFLWVVLVVRSVIEGLSEGDSIKLLETRVQQIPRELGPFFEQIMRSIPALYHKQRALYFKIALETPHNLTLMHYSFLDQCFESYQSAFDAPIRPMDSHDIFRRHGTMRRRLNARCKGLLDSYMIHSASEAHLSHRVTFLHRTVRDFFLSDEMTHAFEDTLGDHPVNITMLTAYLAFIKALPDSKAIRPLLEDSLFYAHRAEKEAPDEATRCVDELFGVIIEQGGFSEDSDELANLAVQYGLCGYVSACIKDSLPGFKDMSALLKHSLDSSISPNPEQVDMAEMVKMLLASGATIDSVAWGDYASRLSLVIRDAKSTVGMVSGQKQILNLLIPRVKLTSVAWDGPVAWGDVFTSTLEREWIPTAPTELINIHIELLELFLLHGANPNLMLETSSLWVQLSIYIRASSQRRRARNLQSGPKTQNEIPYDILTRLVESFLAAGADLSCRSALSLDEVNRIFPRRLASHIADAMTQQKRNKLAKTQRMGWVEWIVSFAWGR